MNARGQVGPLAYRIRGNGPDIVFVHGNGSTHETWNDVVRQLAGNFRCITPDLRGHGQSRLGDAPLTLDTLCDDLERLREHLGLDRFMLVGHSLGSFIAATYASRNPQYVDRLCLIATPANRTEQDREAADSLLEQIRKQGVRKMLPLLAKSWYTDEFVATHPGSLQRRFDQVLSIDEDVFVDTYTLYSNTDVDDAFRQLAMPTLVMTGEHARGSGTDVARFIADQVPDAHLVIFRAMKNGVLTEIPHRLAQEISDFYSLACQS